MKKIFSIALCAMMAFAWTACEEINNDPASPDEETTPPEGETPEDPVGPGEETPEKTVLLAELSQFAGTDVLWYSDDQITVNGVESLPLVLAAPSSEASFEFESVLTAPYTAVIPSSIIKDETTVTLPAVQESVEYPMIASSATEELIFYHACAAVKLDITSSDNVISYVEFSGNASEQVCGDFTVNFTDCTIVGTGANDANTTVKVNVGKANPGVISIVVPEGSYSAGFTVKVVDSEETVMTIAVDAAELVAGAVHEIPASAFVPDVKITAELVAQNVMEANEILPYNGKCLLVRGSDKKIYRMAYDEAAGTFADAELKADWSGYVTMWLAKTPGNYLHFGNMYVTWATYNCGDDASTLPAWNGICDGTNQGVIIAGADAFWPIRSGHPSGILGIQPDGRLLYYGLDEYSRLISRDGVYVHAYTEGFNFAGYSSKTFCYGYDLICVDNEGGMWLHTCDQSTMTYSVAPTQIGRGWDKYTHLIPWGEDLLARDAEGNLYKYDFNLDTFWGLE